MVTETLVASPSRRLFTTADIERMLAAGVLHEGDRVELIAGEILAMAAMGPKLLRCVNRLTRLLVRVVGDAASVSVQNAIILSDRMMPQPDLAILRGQDEEETVPTAADVLVVIEVSDSSLLYDLNTKLPLLCGGGHPGGVDRRSRLGPDRAAHAAGAGRLQRHASLWSRRDGAVRRHRRARHPRGRRTRHCAVRGRPAIRMGRDRWRTSRARHAAAARG